MKFKHKEQILNAPREKQQIQGKKFDTVNCAKCKFYTIEGTENPRPGIIT